MKKLSQEKIIAGAKIGIGMARMAGGVATGCGMGIIGGALRQRHMMVIATRLAVLSVKGGKVMFDEGLAEWKEAQ